MDIFNVISIFNKLRKNNLHCMNIFLIFLDLFWKVSEVIYFLHGPCLVGNARWQLLHVCTKENKLLEIHNHIAKKPDKTN